MCVPLTELAEAGATLVGVAEGTATDDAAAGVDVQCSLLLSMLLSSIELRDFSTL
ncbi:MAG: hypothetical protein ABI128_03980 [Rhodanobacter sp.]